MKTNYAFDRGRRKEVEISMTPMIDVIFLLLVFFITTSSFQVVEKLLPSGVSDLKSVAGGNSDPPPEVTQAMLEQIVIKLSLNGNDVVAVLNGQPLASLDELFQRLKTIGQVSPNAPVIIDPDAKVPAGVVVKAYDRARASGLTSVFMATRKPSLP
jgi:biopolymer transport protein ExbD